VGVIALALRWPYLMLVPRLTDETAEIKWAWRIAQGEILPLTHVDPYYGIVHPYLLAGLFTALGPHTILPRALNAVAGALLAALVAWVAWGMAGRTEDQGPRTEDRNPNWSLVLRPSSALGGSSSTAASLVAGLLTAASFPLIVVNSHIAWSNGLTPLFVTGALAATWFAVMDRRGWWLVGAGFLWGLALQTHPSVVTLLPGVVAWVIWQPTGRGWLRTRWPWLALGAAILMVSNLIGYNVLTAGGSAEGAARRDYAFTGGVGLSEYLANAQGFVGLAYQMVGSTFVSTLGGDAGAAAMRSPAVILYAVVAVTAVLYTARRAGLPLACWLAALALLPIINRAYDSHISARYMAPLLPPTFAAMGALLAAGVAMLRGGSWARLAVGASAATLAMLLVVYPAARLNNYYFFELADGRNNARLWQLVDAVRGPGQAGTPILLDRGLRDARLDAGGHVYKALGTLLDLERVPHQNPRVEELPTAPDGALLVLTDAQREALASILRLTPVDVGAPPLPAAPGGYWLYRVDSH